MSDTIADSVTITITDEMFSDTTQASGTFTANYDAEGNLVSVTNVNVQITGNYFQASGDPTDYSTTFTGAVSATTSNGLNEFTLADYSNLEFGPTVLAWSGTNPTALDPSSYVTTGPGANPTDPSGGTPKFLDPNGGGGSVTSQTACFMAGSHVLTPHGDIAIETLKIGDIVTLSDGRVAPVSWVGIQTVSTKFADPLRALPIRIKAGALADAMPARDLLISPDHAILVGDILVQAGALVNEVSIVRETNLPSRFIYYHVEVADHSLIVVDGVAAETFVDNVDRMGFDNWAEHKALYGDDVTIVEMDYPRARSARQVPSAIRASLSARAQALYGVELTIAA